MSTQKILSPLKMAALLTLIIAYSSCDLSVLNDEFDDASTLADWNDINVTEGWGISQVETIDINTTEPGHLVMVPYTCAWFQDRKGPFFYKMLNGNFEFTASVEISNRTGDGLPQSNFSLAGIMIRAPRELNNGAAGWADADPENYVFLSIGRADPGMCGGCPPPHLEVKTTENNVSILRISPISAPIAVLRLVRKGSIIQAFYQIEGGDFVLHQEYDRPDLPVNLQVGLVAYTDWPHAGPPLPVLEHNSTTLIDPNFRPDLRAKFDYARFDN